MLCRYEYYLASCLGWQNVLVKQQITRVQLVQFLLYITQVMDKLLSPVPESSVNGLTSRRMPACIASHERWPRCYYMSRAGPKLGHALDQVPSALAARYTNHYKQLGFGHHRYFAEVVAVSMARQRQ